MWLEKGRTPKQGHHKQKTQTPKTRTKGTGEGGYVGAPASVSSAINRALEPLGKSIHELPMRINNIHKILRTECET